MRFKAQVEGARRRDLLEEPAATLAVNFPLQPSIPPSLAQGLFPGREKTTFKFQYPLNLQLGEIHSILEDGDGCVGG